MPKQFVSYVLRLAKLVRMSVKSIKTTIARSALMLAANVLTSVLKCNYASKGYPEFVMGIVVMAFPITLLRIRYNIRQGREESPLTASMR